MTHGTPLNGLRLALLLGGLVLPSCAPDPSAPPPPAPEAFFTLEQVQEALPSKPLQARTDIELVSESGYILLFQNASYEGDLELAALVAKNLALQESQAFESGILFYALLLGGEYTAAADWLETHPLEGSFYARLFEAVTAIQQSDHRRTRGHLDAMAAHAITPRQKFILYNCRFWLALTENQPDEATLYFQKAWENLNPDQNKPWRLFYESQHLVLTGELGQALADLEQNSSPENETLRLFRTRLFLTYRLTQTSSEREAAIERNLQKRAQAGALQAHEARLLRQNPDLYRRPVYTSRDVLGLAMLDAALGLFGSEFTQGGGLDNLLLVRLATRLAPENQEVQFRLLQFLTNQFAFVEAQAIFESLGQDTLWGLNAQLTLAAGLADHDYHALALELLLDLVETQPDFAPGWLALGEFLHTESYFSAALPPLSRYLEAFPKEIAAAAETAPAPPPPSPLWRVYFLRAIAYERTLRWKEAEADFLYALELSPDQPSVLNYLGYSWVTLGRNATQARALIEKAVELDPDNGYIIDSLGWVYYLQEAYEPAVELLEKALFLVPDNAVISDHLGDAYWRTGREREARYQWRSALLLDPEGTEIRPAYLQEKLQKGLP